METIHTVDEARLHFKDGRRLTEWVKEYLTHFHGREIFEDDEINHIVHCLQAIIGEAFDIAPCGDFGYAVLKNNFTDAVCRADETNKRVLDIYARFIANYIPLGKIKKGGN